MTVTENSNPDQRSSEVKVHGGGTSSGHIGFLDFPKLGPRPAGIWRLGVHYTPMADIAWARPRIFSYPPAQTHSKQVEKRLVFGSKGEIGPIFEVLGGCARRGRKIEVGAGPGVKIEYNPELFRFLHQIFVGASLGNFKKSCFAANYNGVLL